MQKVFSIKADLGGVGGLIRHLFQMVLHRAADLREDHVTGIIQMIIIDIHSSGILLIVQIDSVAFGACVQINVGRNIAALAVGCAKGNRREGGAAGVSGDVDIEVRAVCFYIQVNSLVLAGVGFFTATQQIGGNAVKGCGIGLIFVGADKNTRDGRAGIGGRLVTQIDLVGRITTALIQVIFNNGKAIVFRIFLGVLASLP